MTGTAFVKSDHIGKQQWHIQPNQLILFYNFCPKYLVHPYFICQIHMQQKVIHNLFES